MGAIFSLLSGALRVAVPLLGGFCTGGLSWAWSALSAFLGTSIGAKVAIALGCLLAGWVWGFSHEHAAKEQAVAEAIARTAAERDSEWSRKLEQANAEIDARVENARAASQAVPSAGSLSDADLVRLCTASKACRGQTAARRRLPGN